LGAPVVEELLFRGLLLNRWIRKWWVGRAVFVSSLLFAFLHTDHLGSFVHGYVFSIYYLQTRSLKVPIIIHSMNNAIVYGIASVVLLVEGGEAQYSLADFQAQWWLGAIGIVVGGPWLVLFLRGNGRLRGLAASST
jgi:CAAX protease family protein